MADDGYGKYRKMLKMGIPRLQVETAMRMDGKDLSKFSEQDPNEEGPVGESGGMDLSLKGDAYDKYRKMLKCGLPMGAAMQAMAKDGVDPKGFDVSGGGASNTTSDSPLPPVASSPQVEIRETSSGGDGGGGFLSELKAKAEKTAASGPKATQTTSSPAPVKSVTKAPVMSPPKPVAAAPRVNQVTPPPVPPQQKPTPSEKPQSASSPSNDTSATLFRPRNASPKVESVSSPSPVVVKEQKALDTPVAEVPKAEELVSAKPEPVVEVPKERPVPPPKVSPVSSKSTLASSLAMPSYRVVTGSKPVAGEVATPSEKIEPAIVTSSPRQETDTAAQDVLAQVLASDSEANVTETVAPPAAREVEKSVPRRDPSSLAAPTKKWTAPAKTSTSGIGSGDWKSLMAANKISSAAPGSTEAETAVESSVESAVRLETASPNVESKRDSPTTSPRETIPTKSAPPAMMNTVPRASPPTKPPVSIPSTVTKQATVAAPAAARTLKKRHSNDYKTMLAPFIDPPKGPSSMQQSTPSAVESAKPVIQAPPPPAIPKPMSSSGPVNTSGARGVNDVGLKTQQRLPAWAVVEQPSFLVKEDGAQPKMSQSTSSTPSVRASAVPPVNKAPVATNSYSNPKSVSAAPLATPQVQKPTPAVVMQPATGSIPKGFQRRFAWEQ